MIKVEKGKVLIEGSLFNLIGEACGVVASVANTVMNTDGEVGFMGFAATINDVLKDVASGEFERLTKK